MLTAFRPSANCSSIHGRCTSHADTELAAAAAATMLVAGSAPAARQPDPVKYTVINLVEPQPGQEDDTKAYLIKHGDHVATYDGALSFRLFEIVPGRGQSPA